MRVLVVGSTGMLGQSLMRFFEAKYIHVDGVARQNATFQIDVATDFLKLEEVIVENRYDVIINTVAVVNLLACEQNVEYAYKVNTHIVGEMAKLCSRLRIYFVQISTDHFYNDHGSTLHTEQDAVLLCNEYAKTKYLAEKLVEIYPHTMIVRTNIVGFRQSDQHTFIEWIIHNIQQGNEIQGFTNMFTSSIDVDAFSAILYELICKRVGGVINVSADGVVSKFDFIYALAKKFGKAHLVKQSELHDGEVTRAKTLGLCLEKLKGIGINSDIPTVYDVVDRIYEQYLEK